MPTTVYLDMDGVIVNLIDAIFGAYGVDAIDEHPPHYYQTRWDGYTAVLSGVDGALLSRTPEEQNEEVWAHVHSLGSDFWSTLDWTRHGRRIYQVCKETYDRVFICTTPTRSSYSTAGKQEWIQKNLPGCERDFVFTSHKYLLAKPGTLLVDDKPKNVKLFRQHGGQALLWPAPWNTPESPDQWATGRSVDEAIETLKILGGWL